VTAEIRLAESLIDESSKRKLEENLEQYEQLFGADEDAFHQPTTTRKELWSYYLYYNVRLLNHRRCHKSLTECRVIMESVQDRILRLSFSLHCGIQPSR
jgi:hypothetical protein